MSPCALPNMPLATPRKIENDFFNADKMYCGAIRRGDIYLCAMGSREKAVLVLQDNVLNQVLPTIVCALVEPDDGSNFVNEVRLKSKETGLGKNGICHLHKILSVDRRLVIAKKGEVSKEKMVEIFKALDVTLGRFRDRK